MKRSRFGGVRVARELDWIAELRGYPCLVVSDNGNRPVLPETVKLVFQAAMLSVFKL